MQVDGHEPKSTVAHDDVQQINNLYPSPLPHYKRARLVAFIAEVCESYSFNPWTTSFAVQYLDRYVSRAAARNCLDEIRLDVVTGTCIIVAAKFSEMKVPAMHDLLMVIAEYEPDLPVLTKELLARVELRVLEMLGWHLHTVTPFHVLEQLCAELEPLPVVRRLASSIIQMSVFMPNAIKFLASTIAVSALALASELHQSGCQNCISWCTLKACCCIPDDSAEQGCSCERQSERLLDECKQMLASHFRETASSTLHSREMRSRSPDCITDPLLDVSPPATPSIDASGAFKPLHNAAFAKEPADSLPSM